MAYACRGSRIALCLAVALVVAAPRAEASNPSAIYVYPSQVELLPNETTATEVVIHGAFFFWNTDGTYTAPKCGYMYFKCAAGQETMCRMQWSEIKAAIGGSSCEGFGAQMMVSKATLRTEGTPLASPDAWDLGIGITPGVFVGGQCDPAKMLKCTLPSPDMAMGAADMTMSPADMTMSPVDMAMAQPDLTVKADMAKPAQTTDSCTVGRGVGGGTSARGLLAFALLGVFAALGRRYRRARKAR